MAVGVTSQRLEAYLHIDDNFPGFDLYAVNAYAIRSPSAVMLLLHSHVIWFRRLFLVGTDRHLPILMVKLRKSSCHLNVLGFCLKPYP